MARPHSFVAIPGLKPHNNNDHINAVLQLIYWCPPLCDYLTGKVPSQVNLKCDSTRRWLNMFLAKMQASAVKVGAVNVRYYGDRFTYIEDELPRLPQKKSFSPEQMKRRNASQVLDILLSELVREFEPNSRTIYRQVPVQLNAHSLHSFTEVSRTNPFADLFRFEVEAKIRYEGCSLIDQKSIAFTTLTLAIPPPRPDALHDPVLGKLVRKVFKHRFVSSYCPYRRPGDPQVESAFQNTEVIQHHFYRLKFVPNYMIVHLSREWCILDTGKFGMAPLVMDDPLRVKDNSGGERYYRLYSAILHIGDRDRGHFSTIVRQQADVLYDPQSECFSSTPSAAARKVTDLFMFVQDCDVLRDIPFFRASHLINSYAVTVTYRECVSGSIGQYLDWARIEVPGSEDVEGPKKRGTAL